MQRARHWSFRREGEGILSRRAFLRLACAAASTTVLAACSSPPAAPAQPAKPKAAEPTKPTAAATQAPKPAADAKPTQAAPATTAATAAKPAASTPAAASKPAAGAGVPPPKEITIVQGVDVSSLDPHVEASVAARNIFYNVFGYLALPIPVDPPQLRNELAESWEWTNDRTLRFTLRQNVTFHNGEPFDASSVKFTIERILNPQLKSVWAASLSTVEAVNVVDPYTLDIVSKTPYVPLLAEVGRMAMLPPKYAAEVGDQQLSLKPIGTGPFKVTEWVKGERVVVEANPGYWRGAPSISKVTYRGVPEAAARIAELVTGRADIVSDVPPEFEGQIEAAGHRVATVRAPRVVYVGMDTRQKPFDDVRVRRAVNYAVDRDTIITGILGNHGYKVPGPFGPNIAGFDGSLTGYEYNPDRAKQLLSEAGYADGFETSIHLGPGRFLKDKEIAEAVAGQLQKVGVRAKLEPQEYNSLLKAIFDGSLTGMHLISWIAVTGDPDLMLKYLDSKRLGKYYANPEVDALIQTVLTTTDEAKRLQAIKDVQKKVVEEAPWLFLFDLEAIWGVSKRIDWQPLPNDLINVTDIQGRA